MFATGKQRFSRKETRWGFDKSMPWLVFVQKALTGKEWSGFVSQDIFVGLPFALRCVRWNVWAPLLGTKETLTLFSPCHFLIEQKLLCRRQWRRLPSAFGQPFACRMLKVIHPLGGARWATGAVGGRDGPHEVLLLLMKAYPPWWCLSSSQPSPELPH